MSLQAVKHRQALERKIVGMIVEDALARGYRVAIDNGDHEMTAPFSHFIRIMSEAMRTDEEALVFYKDDEDDGLRRVGAVYLVYGNDGFDAIADHTDNKETRAIIRRAEAFAETAEAEERV